jgi:hypothetical protein
LCQRPAKEVGDSLDGLAFTLLDGSLLAGVIAGVYGRPRTYGLTATWRFGAGY